MQEAISNAEGARHSSERAPRSLIVTGDERQATYWSKRAKFSLGPHHSVVVERGYKGNFLGTLQAYATFYAENPLRTDDPEPLQQIVMLVGAGTRLSPFTQALGNMKSAFPIPAVDQVEVGISVGEAAIRSTAPWIGSLDRGGFDGLVVRWGDEVQIPSVQLSAKPGQFEDFDAIRFGWRTDPTALLASQKEWFLADSEGVIVRDIQRQSLESLVEVFSAESAVRPLVPYVNLGSLAASHELLQAACAVFKSEILNPAAAANWDPYFWIALQCESLEQWDEIKALEAKRGVAGIVKLTAGLPHFFTQVQRVKETLQERKGRKVQVGVLDFGQPYWLDAGSHFALRKLYSDVFSPSEDGQIVRAFLGLPDSIAAGDSFVKDSTISSGARIRNSIVIGAEITDPRSDLDGAIVVGGQFGLLKVSKGGVAIYSRCQELTVEGPHGIAFRLQGNYSVSGQESAASLVSDDSGVTLRYDEALGSINDSTYFEPVLGNSMSYQQAAEIMNASDPSWLDQYWSAK